jgi:hypothetical protein
MAKKKTTPQTKKTFTDAQLDTYLIEIPKLLAGWRQDPTKKRKIGSIYDTIIRWSQEGQGVKTQIKEKLSAINSFINGYKLYPDSNVLKIIDTLKKEYIDMGGDPTKIKTL